MNIILILEVNVFVGAVYVENVNVFILSIRTPQKKMIQLIKWTI